MSDPKVNVIKGAEDTIYSFEDKQNIRTCTNKRGAVVDVTAAHYERYRDRDKLELVDSDDKFLAVKNQKGIQIKTTERWFKNNGEKFGYSKSRATSKSVKK